MYLVYRIGKLLGEDPFERPWMASYIDRQLRVDACRTRKRLAWDPRERLAIERRMPFLMENLKTDPVEWHRRNHAAMRVILPSPNLRIHRLLERHEQRIGRELSERMLSADGQRRFPSYQRLSEEQRGWNHRVALRRLMDSIRSGDKSVYRSFCRDLAEIRFNQGFRVEEVCGALRALKEVALWVLESDPEAEGLKADLDEYISMTLLFGCDQVEDTFDSLQERADRSRRGRAAAAGPSAEESGGEQ
jgi:hypothetical protein